MRHLTPTSLFLLSLFILAGSGSAQGGPSEREPADTVQDKLRSAISSSDAIYYCEIAVVGDKWKYTLKRKLLETHNGRFSVGDTYKVETVPLIDSETFFGEGVVVFQNGLGMDFAETTVADGKMLGYGFISLDELKLVIDDVRHGTDGNMKAIFSRKKEDPAFDVRYMHSRYVKLEFPRKGRLFGNLIASLTYQARKSIIDQEEVLKYLGKPDSEERDGVWVRYKYLYQPERSGGEWYYRLDFREGRLKGGGTNEVRSDKQTSPDSATGGGDVGAKR